MAGLVRGAGVGFVGRRGHAPDAGPDESAEDSVGRALVAAVLRVLLFVATADAIHVQRHLQCAVK